MLTSYTTYLLPDSLSRIKPLEIVILMRNVHGGTGELTVTLSFHVTNDVPVSSLILVPILFLCFYGALFLKYRLNYNQLFIANTGKCIDQLGSISAIYYEFRRSFKRKNVYRGCRDCSMFYDAYK